MDGINRVMDANANRAREGARVLEDIARFILEDAALSLEWKRARHGITEALEGLETDFMAGREPGTAAGRGFEHGKGGRKGFIGIAKANSKRAEEGVRVLEEFTRLNSPEACMRLQQLRFEIYSLEKKTVLALQKMGSSRKGGD